MGFATAAAIASIGSAVSTEIRAKKAEKAEKRFTKQAKAEALEERKQAIDEQRLQLGVGTDGFKTRATTPGATFTQQGEVLG